MFRSPSMAGLPSLETMLQDLPANLNQTARHLGISLQTLKKYSKAGQAPRVVLLALFWETRWGRSAANTEAANFATVQHRLATHLSLGMADILSGGVSPADPLKTKIHIFAKDSKIYVFN